VPESTTGEQQGDMRGFPGIRMEGPIMSGWARVTWLLAAVVFPSLPLHPRLAAADAPAAPAARINAHKPPGPAPEGMVWIPGGWFWMGEETIHRGSRPSPRGQGPEA